MQGEPFDEAEFFKAIETSGARALLIGRRALIALGLQLMTGDYDFWLHIDDIATFNSAVERFDLHPNHNREAARKRGRYLLENSERVDVLIARAMPTVGGQQVRFEDVWERRQTKVSPGGYNVTIPSIEDLILTKRFAARPKDAEDIRMLLTILKDSG